MLLIVSCMCPTLLSDRIKMSHCKTSIGLQIVGKYSIFLTIRYLISQYPMYPQIPKAARRGLGGSPAHLGHRRCLRTVLLAIAVIGYVEFLTSCYYVNSLC